MLVKKREFRSRLLGHVVSLPYIYFSQHLRARYRSHGDFLAIARPCWGSSYTADAKSSQSLRRKISVKLV
jgi:hypothetical protein